MKEKIVLENVFLDSKLQIEVEQYRNKNKKIYKYIERFNKECYRLKDCFSKKNVNKRIY